MSDFEPVELDFIIGGNTETEGAKIIASMKNIAAEQEKAKSAIKTQIADTKSNIKQIESDLTKLEAAFKKAAPGRGKELAGQELGAAKRALEEEKAALVELGEKVNITAEKHRYLRTKVLEAKDALAQMEMAGKRGSVEYNAVAAELGRLNDQMSDTAAQANILADDQKGFRAVASGVSGLAGALSAATGMAALFGAENEELARIQTRLQAVMAISIGLQQVSETLNKDSYFSVVLLTRAKNMWAVANLKVATTLGITTVASKALMLTGIGVLVAGVIGLVVWLDKLSTKQKESAQRAKEVASKMADSAAEPIVAYKKLQSQWNDLGNDLDAKKKFVTDNKDAFHDLGVEVDNVTAAENVLVKNTEAFQQAMIARAKAAAATELATEQFKKSLAKQAEVNEMSDTIEVKTASQYNVPGNSAPMNTYDVANQTKISAQKKVDEMNEVAENYIKMSEDETKKFEALLKEAGIKKAVEDGKTKEKVAKEVYDAESAITDLILDIRAKRTKLEIDQQKDSLQKRLEGIRLERDEQVRGIEDKEKTIVDAYNKNHKGEKGFKAKTSLSQIDPKLAEDLAKEKANITKAYGQKEVTETEKYQQEISDLIFQYADERTQIAYNYNKDIEKARELGLNEWADDMEKEKQQRINDVTLGLIEETELYKVASDDKLELSRETTQLLIEDLQRRIDAEIAAGRLSKEQGEKWLKDLETAQKMTGERGDKNNPFAQLSSAIKGNKAAQTAFKEAPIGTSTEDLAKLESAAATATASMASAAGASLMGVQAILGSVVGGLDQLGMLTDEQKKDADNIIGMVGGAANIAMGIATGNPIAIIQGSIDLLVNGIEFFDFKNKALEKSQKQHMKNVEDLELKYKKLQRAVETALGTDVYKAQRDQIANQKKQIQEYEAWLVAENQKKKRKQDADKIKDTQAKIADLKNSIQDEAKAIAEAFAQTDAKSLANELADSITNAFMNGEDAALAFGDVAEQVMQNAVKNALKLQFLEKPMQNAVDQLAKDMESGGSLSDAEQAAFRKKIEDAGQLYYEQLAQYSDLFTSNGSSQTGIKGDVAKMTEETGSALVGQIIAMRLNVAALLANSKSSLDSVAKVLSSLEAIRENTLPIAEIRDTLNYLKLNGIKVN